MAMGERIWLKHNETGGFFHAPAAVVDVFEGLGWEPCDEPPADTNPVIAERLAFEQQQLAAQTKAETKTRGRAKPEPKPEPAFEPDWEDDTSTTTPRAGSTEEEG